MELKKIYQQKQGSFDPIHHLGYIFKAYFAKVFTELIKNLTKILYPAMKPDEN